MRLFTLGLFVALTSVGYSQQFFTQAFVYQDFHSKEWKTIERFGLGETEIFRMGHDSFVKWYCDDSRAGKDAKIQAEKVYSLAINECNAPLLLRLPRKEQAFLEQVYTSFGDMAKSSFVAGILGTSEGPAWSLPIAESSTAVNAAVHALLDPTDPVPSEEKVDLEASYNEVTERAKGNDPTLTSSGGRLKFLVGYIEKNFKDRSKRDKAIAKSFCVKMVKMALLKPSAN